MEHKGNLLKMRAEASLPVAYFLQFEGKEICINDLLGKRIEIKYQQEINCIKCGKKTKKSFAQGFCYPCFASAPETEECVLRPELCQAHEGRARDMDYAKKHCLNDHFVYLSLTSGVKVGVTRSSQIPTRWIDQGAVQAIKIARTPNRYLAGCIEVALKEHFADKTNWRNMLKQIIPEVDLLKERSKALSLLSSELSAYALQDEELVSLEFPVLKTLEKVKSISLDKEDIITETLAGIKGQYLIFESERVMNIRKHGGYKVSLAY